MTFAKCKPAPLPVLDITGANGVPFRVRYVPTGSPYGRDNCLTNDGSPLVEFYDMRYPDCAMGDGVPGQFTGARYFVSTLVEGERTGLVLDGSNAASWTVDNDAMAVVREWLRLLTRRDHHSARLAHLRAQESANR